MEVSISEEGNHSIISLSGDLDASSSISLDNAFTSVLSSQRSVIFVDCTKLDYISSPGIGVFISRLGDCERQGIRLGLFGVSDKILKVFKILGLDQLIIIGKTKQEAELNINATQPSDRV